jgi:hypothetical protein
LTTFDNGRSADGPGSLELPFDDGVPEWLCVRSAMMLIRTPKGEIVLRVSQLQEVHEDEHEN